MELFDMQGYAQARHRDALRSFRFAERSGLTRDTPVAKSAKGTSNERERRALTSQEWSANAEG